MSTSDIRRDLPRNPAPHGDPADWLPDRAAYSITVKGCLDASWSEWFDGLAISADRGRGETTLAGHVADQTALHGLLAKVRDLGLTLVHVERLDAERAAGGPHPPMGDDHTY